MIAQRTNTSLYYLHGDHLGSVSLSTSSAGTLLSSQDFKPLGEVRSGAVTETTLNYTGQRKDGTGLLYYHARYYEPLLTRFISADTVIPRGATVLVVDYHEVNLLNSLNTNEQDGQSVATNSQDYSRYSYVENNPVVNTDPSGHTQFKGGRVINHNHHRVFVFGSIPFEEFQKTHPWECVSISDCAALHTIEAERYYWHLHDGSAEGSPGMYVMGWFALDPGQDSYDTLGMIDADTIMADNGDTLAYCPPDGNV